MAEAIACPYTVQEVATLARDHKASVAPGVAAYVRVFATVAAEMLAVLEPFLRDGTYRSVDDGGLRRSLTRFVERLDDEERLKLARLEVDSSVESRPCLEFLEDLRCHEFDDARAADLIIDSYQRTGTNNDRRRDLLDVWDRCQIGSPTARKRLIDDVLLDMVSQGGRQALEHILTRPQLWANPEGRKNAVRDAFRNVAGGKNANARLERLLLDHEVVTQRKRALGLLPPEEIDEPPD